MNEDGAAKWQNGGHLGRGPGTRELVWEGLPHFLARQPGEKLRELPRDS